ncbi:DUF2339 domain-containing protein [Parachryseolinea silvisoli]|uniref:DUF2339 domain-containing protein n=1 Tax=Parachryseolinea silvisoli TaxID=2873601 RepID=UPI0022657F21|nr:DUF2339 domain-containing protein [Parachryseolinea silvisoli]MCD9018531.1 DUF2339 domain-containing protein [Parachryseolinea silvisoli]
MEEFFSFLIFITLVIIVVLIANLRTKLQNQITVLQFKIDDLKTELGKARLKEGAAPAPVTAREEVKPQPAIPIVPPVPVSRPVTPPPIPTPVPPPVAPPVQAPAPPVKPETVAPPVRQEAATTTVRPLSDAPKPTTPPPAYVPPAPKPGFFERNPDLEKFIGENLANKIGIGILVLGIGFFVKYAIDQQWINEIGRVFIGILCGGILLGVAHRLRKTFAPFSSVLVGGGIAVLYFTIGIAFHDYHIFSQTAAFLLMVVITGFAIVLSLGYDRIELAILAILGGFATPLMVSTGEGNYVVLFTYILVLDIGMLVLAYYKKWNLVNIVSYVFTMILYFAWLGKSFDGENLSMVAGALIFATLFYIVFFLMNIINNLRQRTTFKAIEISLLLSNTFLYYTAGMIILNQAPASDFRGLFTATLAIFNFIFAYSLYKNTRVDRNLVFLLIGLVLTFISLAAPVQLEGNYITLFWAAEGVLLLWLSQKSGIRLMKVGSVLVMILMGCSLVMDWEQLYVQTADYMPVVLNKAYITSVVSLISIALTVYFLRFEKDERDADYIGPYRQALIVSGTLALYASQYLELHYQIYRFVDAESAGLIIIGAYNMLFLVGLLLAVKRSPYPDRVKQPFAIWGPVAMFAFLIFYHYQIIDARDGFLLGDFSSTGFIFHYVYVALLLVVCIITLREVRQIEGFTKQTHNLHAWLYVFFFLFLASTELDHSVLMLAQPTEQANLDHILHQNHKIGYPILWGLGAFLLIYLGMRQRKKHLRIISLTLLLVTLLKLVIFDLKGISEGGKIAAFISLGVLLLVVSFMYQRLKKLLLTDEAVAPAAPTAPSGNEATPGTEIKGENA